MISRLIAVGSIAVTGALLAAGGAASVGAAPGPTATVLAVPGVALGGVLVAGSVLLYRSDDGGTVSLSLPQAA